MPRDDDIDDQVRKDWEFTRRAQELMSRLRKQNWTESSAQDPTTGDAAREGDETPDE
jgi:hypothetical protein